MNFQSTTHNKLTRNWEWKSNHRLVKCSASSPTRILSILTFQLPRQEELLPGPTFSGGFIHQSILCLTGSKHSGGAQGTQWCHRCVMVTVFPMICHLFQATLIKNPHLVWHLRKLKLLLYWTSQIHLYFGKWAFASQSSKNNNNNWTVFLCHFSRSSLFAFKGF